MRYNTFFRPLLRDTVNIFNGIASLMDNFRDSWRKYQRLSIETFLRRILLILHQPFGQRPKAHDNLIAHNNKASPPRLASHWSLLECSLAILVAQRQMLEDAPSGGPLSTSRQLYEGLLKQDFFIAVLFAGTSIALCNIDSTTNLKGRSQGSFCMIRKARVVTFKILYAPRCLRRLHPEKQSPKHSDVASRYGHGAFRRGTRKKSVTFGCTWFWES